MSAASASGVCSTPCTMRVLIVPACRACDHPVHVADRSVRARIDHVEHRSAAFGDGGLQRGHVGQAAARADVEPEIARAAHVRGIDGRES